VFTCQAFGWLVTSLMAFSHKPSDIMPCHAVNNNCSTSEVTTLWRYTNACIIIIKGNLLTYLLYLVTQRQEISTTTITVLLPALVIT